MRDSKKAILSTCLVVLLIVCLSLIILIQTAPFVHNYDWELREELSGELDFLIIGASHGQCALYTRTIDEILGCNSYNLSYDSMKNYEKEYLLKKEIQRNDIKTVVLELSYDTLFSSGKTDYTDANLFSTNRMDSFSDRLFYFFNYVRLNNKWYVYSDSMYEGMYAVKNGLSVEHSIDENQYDLKGSRFIDGKDHSLADEEIISSYNSKSYDVPNFNQETLDGFTEMIQLCRENGIRVIVAVVPVTDNYIWRYDKLDDFNDWVSDYCRENGAEYYDFNLLKERFELFSDADCYSTDTHHMSEKGSRIFSKVFSEIIMCSGKGDDVSELFYDSFELEKLDSPYMEYYITHND